MVDMVMDTYKMMPGGRAILWIEEVWIRARIAAVRIRVHA
jgi:hypothetical protein